MEVILSKKLYVEFYPNPKLPFNPIAFCENSSKPRIIMLQETVARNVCSLLASELIASINVRRLSRKALFAPWAAPTARPPLQTTRANSDFAQLSLWVDGLPKCNLYEY